MAAIRGGAVLRQLALMFHLSAFAAVGDQSHERLQRGGQRS